MEAERTALNLRQRRQQTGANQQTRYPECCPPPME
jgi:hypothetical protein